MRKGKERDALRDAGQTLDFFEASFSHQALTRTVLHNPEKYFLAGQQVCKTENFSTAPGHPPTQAVLLLRRKAVLQGKRSLDPSGEVSGSRTLRSAADWDSCCFHGFRRRRTDGSKLE